MRKKRTIIIRNPKLRKIRDNLRTILNLAVNKKLEVLMDQMYAIKTDTEENYEKRCSLKRDIDELSVVWESSITMCSSCSAVDRDLRFNPIAGGWYFLECYKMYRDNYYKTMEKKKRGEFIGSDYDEELARSFTE